MSNEVVEASRATSVERSASEATEIVDVEPVGEIWAEGEVDAARTTAPLNPMLDPSRIVSVIDSGVDVATGGVDVASRPRSPVSRSSVKALVAVTVSDDVASSACIHARGIVMRTTATDIANMCCARIGNFD